MRAASVMLYGLYGSVPDLISIDLPNVILFSSFGVTWNGARVFNGRAALPGSLIAGAGALAARLAMARVSRRARKSAASSPRLIIAAYTWLTAYEFWRGRNEPLVSRWPAIVLFFDARRDVPAAHAAQRAAAWQGYRQICCRARG